MPKLAHVDTRRIESEHAQGGGQVHQFTIGDRLRKAREVAGYDQRGFEAASGISRATISAYELGKSKPRRAYLSIWAHVTNTSIDWLIGDDAPGDTPAQDADNNSGYGVKDSSSSANIRSANPRTPAQARPARGPKL